MRWRLAALYDRLTKGHQAMTSPQPETGVPAITIPKGIDYSFPPHPPVAALKAAGITFVVRYVSPDPKKNLTPAERDALLGAGISIGLVWESTAQRMLAGRAAGKADALSADAQATALNMAGIPLYFACDFDATPGDQVLIDAYLDGVADAIGRDRTGIYGGYWPLSRALDAGKAAWAWQTLAWSGGKWDDRAQLRQVVNGIKVGGVSVDLDEAHAADFGQWPRPRPPGPFRHVVPAGNTFTFAQMAKARGTTTAHLIDVTRANASPEHFAILQKYLELTLLLVADGSPRPPMPEGLVYWTSQP